MLYNILVHAHSGLRWVVLLLILVSIVNAARAMGTKRSFTVPEIRMSAITMGMVHLQLIIGMVLYMISPRVQFSSETMGNSVLRFFTVEHTLGMLIAAILITVAHRRVKAGIAKVGFWLYVIGLLVILLSIPWPFRGFGTAWF